VPLVLRKGSGEEEFLLIGLFEPGKIREGERRVVSPWATGGDEKRTGKC